MSRQGKTALLALLLVAALLYSGSYLGVRRQLDHHGVTEFERDRPQQAACYWAFLPALWLDSLVTGRDFTLH